MSTFSTFDLERERNVAPPNRSRPWRQDDDDMEPPEHHRSRAPLWLAILGLAGALAGTSWYTLSRQKEHGDQLARMRGWAEELTGVRNRVGAAEQRIEAMPQEIDSVRRYRRFHGWLQLVDEGKILWLRDQSVLQTFAFVAGRNALRHDLVVTGLTSGGVSGYLILPPQSEPVDHQLASRSGSASTGSN